MTEKEAKIVLDIMETADGGCPYCVRSLIKQFIDKFPEFNNLQEVSDV